MALGPIMLDLLGKQISDEEKELLRHPLVGGVILFTRNYESVEQLTELVNEIHSLRSPRLLVAVDQEGGRVQRFRREFTPLPPARRFGEIYDHDHARGRRLAQTAGWVMASELRACGVDFSFAPVLDLDRGLSDVIGDRAFHQRPDLISRLAGDFLYGMKQAGMAATGKHFPGHGGVVGDSHDMIPVDSRDYETIYSEDIVPFERLAHEGLAAVMPAHVIYDQVDPNPAGFSRFWLQEVLRKRLRFQGVIFSDDLNMEGAAAAGESYLDRAHAALDAGCDMILICNNRAAAIEIVEGLPDSDEPLLHARLARMHGLHPISHGELHRNPSWRQGVEALMRLEDDPSLELQL